MICPGAHSRHRKKSYTCRKKLTSAKQIKQLIFKLGNGCWKWACVYAFVVYMKILFTFLRWVRVNLRSDQLRGHRAVVGNEVAVFFEFVPLVDMVRRLGRFGYQFALFQSLKSAKDTFPSDSKGSTAGQPPPARRTFPRKT